MTNEEIMRQAMLAQSTGQSPGIWGRIGAAGGWNNPLLNIGMGILAANKPGASFGQAVGGGGLLGMQNYQASQYQQARMDELQRKRAEEDRARQAQMQQQERLEQWLATLPPQIQQMYRANPELAMKVLESQMVPEKPTADIQNYLYGMQDPGFNDWRLQSRQAGAPQVNVGATTVKLPQERTEESKTVGKYYGEAYINTQRAAQAARAENAKLDRLNSLFAQTYTGTGGQAVQAAKRAASAFGLDISGYGEAEAASALGNEMALQLRNPAGGAGMPGAMSDKDREFLQSMVPSLATTAEGRQLMVETRRRLNNRSIEVAKMAREYRAVHGALDENFFSQLQEYSDANPLFSDIAVETSGGLSPEQMKRLEELERKYGR